MTPARFLESHSGSILVLLLCCALRTIFSCLGVLQEISRTYGNSMGSGILKTRGGVWHHQVRYKNGAIVRLILW